ncbi:uncharacterized protein L203_104586 [Cryptococcus depauperatus CBS 7841]|uniref:Uncharacterized protein n=1 Tax=Cryptococcus depauperatus CBS 7841 TaxID=1295531 RepID=A0AAJ8JVR9_9TREE
MMSTSSTTDEHFIEFRDKTNFRSVKRADRSVSAILETSVYSVIYHYNEASSGWEKQKQEGPLFVVKREKSPEYMLYMLNRQTVKNPAIPLVPGEMKMTVVDAGMLQVARRGEKMRIGIWFSEGPERVDKFREVILGIVGEPSKRPESIASPSAVSPQLQPSSTGDGLNSKGNSETMAVPAPRSPNQTPAVSQASAERYETADDLLASILGNLIPTTAPPAPNPSFYQQPLSVDPRQNRVKES